MDPPWGVKKKPDDRPFSQKLEGLVSIFLNITLGVSGISKPVSPHYTPDILPPSPLLPLISPKSAAGCDNLGKNERCQGEAGWTFFSATACWACWPGHTGP